MSLPAKRQHEETAAAAKVAEGSGSGAGRQQQHGGGGGGIVMESAAAFGSGAESRPAKVARHNDRGGEAGEKVELFGNSAHANSKPGRDGGGSVSGAMEVTVGEGNSGKEAQVQQPKLKVREFVFTSAESENSDREGQDPGRMDLERKASGGKEYGDVVAESSGNKELLTGKVDVKGEDQVQQHGGSAWKVGQEVADSTRAEGNSEGLRKASPREGEGKVAVKREDVPMDVKREEPREKEKEKENEKKDEKRIERKEDVLPVGLQQQQQLLPQPHLDASVEKDNEKDEKERKKGEKEKERVWERERSRDREKEAVRSEKREKREKERDRESHRREREDRDDGPMDKVEKEEGKGVKIEEMDIVDRKPVRDVDDRKLVEKEGRERVRERNRDKERDEEGEGEKRKKRVREQEKDRDSLNAIDTEVAPGDKDKDAVHGYGVQQRKRLLRPRGQSNPANRDSRSRFRPKDNEGTQGRSESSFINYRVGEGMPELAKLWEEYVSEGKNSSANGPRPTVEIRIPAELATTTNRQIRGSQLWGTDIYTDDSDIVAVLLHTGYYSPSATPPPNSISELRATIQLLESKKHAVYTSTLRNGLRSRAWGGGSGCSYSVERCRIMKQGGGTVELEPCLNRTPQVSPTLAPAASERTITTRAASSSAYRQQRFMQEVTIQYNLCSEPWAKYSMGIVADRNLKNSQFTSARLKKGEVLYVETHAHRYELAYDGERTTCNGATTATSSFPQGTSGGEKAKEKWPSTEQAPTVSEKDPILHTHNGEKAHGNHPSNGHHSHTVIHLNSEPHECYRWSKCKRPLPLSSMKKKGLPLPAEFIEVLEEGLQWEEVQWSTTSVWVRGTEYMLCRAQFFSFDKDDMEE